MSTTEFSEEQKQYLDGFVAGSGLVRTMSLPVVSSSSTPAQLQPVSADPNLAAQDRFIAEGKKLCAEENAKRNLNGLDTWDLVLDHARDGRFPKGTDVFLMKFQGMFYVAPAQDSFMCRLRFPGGICSSTQFRGVADLAETFGGGCIDITTRANLQIRQIGPKHTPDVLIGLHEVGIINRGAGADNIRNITASPTAGIDPQELFDTRDLARRMHHYILNHREMYGLPRKFNIAFDGGGRISALEDTNDIGFTAIKRKSDGSIGFLLTLGGITGHKDFARATGIIVAPDQCIPVAAAIVGSFIEHGDRTDRKKARLKYVLDRIGIDAFVADFEKRLPNSLVRIDLADVEARPDVLKHGHVGWHEQKQAGLHYVGVMFPVGRVTCAQARAIASIADRYGSGMIRLTVWQNLLISDIPTEKIDAVNRELAAAGLTWSATSIRGGLIACTGNAGCKYAAANTKKHAILIADHVEKSVELDQPINIHLTGCHHSCAQHYIGDIGLIATKVGEDAVEGYHIFVGGGYGATQGIARELHRDVIAEDAPRVVESMLRAYVTNRSSQNKSFAEFVRSMSMDQMSKVFEVKEVQS
jgi:ferredoxin-nitrite reductase